MAVTTFDLVVHYEDGSEVTVRADQRDVAAFELKYRVGMGKAMDELTVVFFRYLGWSALRRTGQLDQGDVIGSGWEGWDKRVVEVEPATETEEEEAPSGSRGAPDAA